LRYFVLSLSTAAKAVPEGQIFYNMANIIFYILL
jgi:hypothetical protein